MMRSVHTFIVATRIMADSEQVTLIIIYKYDNISFCNSLYNLYAKNINLYRDSTANVTLKALFLKFTCSELGC